MKKIGSIIFCVIFFGLISIPLVFMPWTGYQLTENRPPSPLPEVFTEEGLNLALPVEFGDYFMDRFAGRVWMVDAYSRLVGGIFGVSSNEKVIMGRDSWLFFYETVGDFDGTAALCDADMDKLTQYLLHLQHEAEARGQVFIIAIAPNKNTVYGEFMPSRYIRTDQPTNLDRLLLNEELNILDLHEVLLSVNERVYFKTDSHWNALGARFVAREIMNVIEDETGIRADFNWEEFIFEVEMITGDLARMLYPANPPREADHVFEDSRQRFQTIGRFRTLDDMHITTESDGAPLRIAMYRDSFAESLIHYFSNAFSNAYYTRQTPPDMTRSEFLEADVVIFQIAERRISELLSFLERAPDTEPEEMAEEYLIEDRDYNENWKIAIITNSLEQDEIGFRSAQDMVLKYGEDRIIHEVFPANHGTHENLLVAVVGNIVADTDVEAIIINPAIGNVNAAIDRVRELRGNDVFIVVASPDESPNHVAAGADLVLTKNYSLVGAKMAENAYFKGAEVIVHYSFERHLRNPSIAIRRESMSRRAQELGLEFVDVEVPDPQERGAPVTIVYVAQNVPRQVAEFGINTAFFATGCLMQEALQSQIAEAGAIYLFSCCPSPYDRFPITFQVEDRVPTGVYVQNPDDPYEMIWLTELRDVACLADAISDEVARRNLAGRFSTWPIPEGMLWTTVGVMYAAEWIKGSAPQDIGVIDIELLAYLAEVFIESLYGERFSVVFDHKYYGGIRYSNWILGSQAFLIFG